MFDIPLRFVTATGVAAGVLWYVTPYMGPTLAEPSKKEAEGARLTRTFSVNKALTQEASV